MPGTDRAFADGCAESQAEDHAVAQRRSRNVSEMDQAQLQRKRQTDRKAQQALRQRVKQRVVSLEEELSSLKDATERTERLLNERIASLEAANTSLVGALQQLSRSAEEAISGLILEPPQGQSVCLTSGFPQTVEEGRDFPDHESPTSLHVNDVTSSQSDRVTHSLTPHETAPHLRDHTTLDSPAYPSSRHKATVSPMADLVLLPDGGPTYLSGPHIAAEMLPVSPPTSIADNVAGCTCLHSLATCPLDRILLDFMAMQASTSFPRAASSAHTHLLAAAIFQPDTYKVYQPLSRMLSDVMSTFYHVSVPEKLGMVFKMHATMRWHLERTTESYETMPRWLRPTATQITIPHAPWIDNIPWPDVRDTLIEKPEQYPFEMFSELYSHSVTVNWPYDHDDVITSLSDGADMKLSPIFEKHVRRLSNWTVTPAFEAHYPELAGLIAGSKHRRS